MKKTNYELFMENTKDIETLAKFLVDSLGLEEDGIPTYAKWFNENYCGKCPIVSTHKDEVNDVEWEYRHCECNDNCYFFQHLKKVPDNVELLTMWLKSHSDNS